MARSRPQTLTVALVGNPNSGKTSLFNALTGSRQKVGNYAGVTVEKVTGFAPGPEGRIEFVDVPGLYSMRPVSVDESVAAGVIVGRGGEGRPDALVCVVDSTNLERNLFFLSQLSGTGVPTVVALTMLDVLEGERQSIDVERLSSVLGIDVVPVASHRNQGLAELKAAVVRAVEDRRLLDVELGFPEAVREPVFRLHERLARAGVDATKSEVREALLDADAALNDRLANLPEMREAFAEERSRLLGESADGRTIEAQTRYAWASRVRRDVTRSAGQLDRRITDRIDRVLTHRVFGLVVFVGLMYLVFQSIYTLAAPLMGLIESGVEALKGWVSPALAAAPPLQSLVVDGVITGIGAVLVFLPQICILFALIAVLEGSGYLARAAFLVDRLVGWCGLNGRAFIPLLSSFACAIPGIMAARVMPDARSRLLTVLIAPFMSCSARLPVYVLLIGAFVEPLYGPAVAGAALFAMHFVGLAFAIPVVALLNRRIGPARRLPFVLELPRYQWPRLRDVAVTVGSRAKVFLVTAGTIIFALSILIWALLSYPNSPEMEAGYRADYSALSPEERTATSEAAYLAMRRTRDSYLGLFGRAIEPVFVPAGFDWRLTTAIVAAFPAREVVVGALGIIFCLGSDVDEGSGDLRTTLKAATWPDGRPLFTVWTAASLMVFFALCAQCMATLATIKRETNSWGWAWFSFALMTGLAYVAAVAVYQVGRAVGG